MKRPWKRPAETHMKVNPETIVSAVHSDYMKEVARDTEIARQLFFELKQDVRSINAPAEVIRKMDRLAELFGITN